MSTRSITADVFDRVHETDDTDHDTDDVVAEDTHPDTAEAGDRQPCDDPSPPSRRLTRPRLTTLVSVALILTSLGAAGFFGWRSYQQHVITNASATALQAARDYAVVLTTLDANNIDDNYRQTLVGATGEFKDAYSQGSAQLRQILIDNKASGTGVVIDAAVKSATPDTVEILLFVDQSITNTANPSPRIDRNRIEMTMVLIDKRWLASRVEIL